MARTRRMARTRMKSACGKPWHNFPNDVLMEIFLRLPVDTLLLFKSVSKHWFTLIQSPDFINLHLNSPISNHANNNPILIVHDIYTESNPRKSVLTLLSDDDETLDYRDEVALESLSPRIQNRGLLFHTGRLLGLCNGLFCLTDRTDIVIFNPATKQHREIPRFPPSSPCNGRLLVGISVPCFDRVCFGFDSVSRDYKVVGFCKIDEQQFNNDCDHDVYSNIGGIDQSDYYRVGIFCLSTNTWTKINRVAPARDMRVLRNCNRDLFFNGAFHWLGSRSSTVTSSIVVFDLNKEAFKQLELPDDFPRRYVFPVHLSVFDECLRIIVLGVVHPDNETEIWVMKEYGVYKSWTKLCNIKVGISLLQPWSCSREGEFLLKGDNGNLVSLNINTMEIKKLEVAIPIGIPTFVSRYRESLVSLSRTSLHIHQVVKEPKLNLADES